MQLPWLLTMIIATLCGVADGHGRLLEPPSRSSLWRFKEYPNAPKNYNDNQLFCGGRFNIILNKGKCGVCGDPYQGPYENEAGGRYATGNIVRRYKPGQEIDVDIEITANHLGFFQFRLCPVKDASVRDTQDCFDKHLLDIVGHGSRFELGTRLGQVRLQVRLPNDITCSHCIFQWRWKGGNSYGVAPNGTSCKGCGYQEMFFGCADVSIEGEAVGGGAQSLPQVPSNQNVVHPVNQLPLPKPQLPVSMTSSRCRAVNLWAGIRQLDQWCVHQCSVGNCPPSTCSCN